MTTELDTDQGPEALPPQRHMRRARRYLLDQLAITRAAVHDCTLEEAYEWASNKVDAALAARERRC